MSMPIFEKTYLPWHGHLLDRPMTWLVIARTGIRLAWRKSLGIILFISFIPFIFRAGQIYILSRFGDEETLLRMVRGIQIDAEFFMSFLKGQAFLLLLLIIVVGAGLIANDRKFNALPIYFSKPVGFWDYIIGKLLIIGSYGILITIIPALILFLMRAMLTQNTDFIRTYYWVPLSIIAWPLFALLVLSSLTLAVSAFSRGARTASILLFSIIYIPELFRSILSRIPNVGLISVHATLNQLGAVLFGAGRPFSFSIGWTSVVLVGIMGLSLLVLRLQVRPTEILS